MRMTTVAQEVLGVDLSVSRTASHDKEDETGNDHESRMGRGIQGIGKASVVGYMVFVPAKVVKVLQVTAVGTAEPFPIFCLHVYSVSFKLGGAEVNLGRVNQSR